MLAEDKDIISLYKEFEKGSSLKNISDNELTRFMCRATEANMFNMFKVFFGADLRRLGLNSRLDFGDEPAQESKSA